MYKTATIINKRTYIGNVFIDGKVYGDRMMKSPYRQYTVFPENLFIDVATNDGDEIIKLESFADRILQFKRNTLYIINVSQELEFQEAEFTGYGITSQSASCKTPHGVIWANSEGMFLYDSQKVTNMLKTGSVTKISSEDWKDFTTFEEDGITYYRKLKVCYIDDNQDVHVYNDNTTSSIDGYKMHIYTGAVGSLKKRFNVGRSSNIINFNTNSYLADYNSENPYIVKWDKTPLMSGFNNNNEVFSLITKDFDFGSPSTLKKIYRVYITYKANNTIATNIGVKIFISVNGENNFVTGATYFSQTDGTYITSGGRLTRTSGAWKQGWFKPKTSVAGKIYSFQIKVASDGNNVFDTSGFEIDDISIVFRSKKPK